jgi:hypothetical protein
MLTSKIKIQGKSGCPIRIYQNEIGYSLIKTAKDQNYSLRLKKQAEKQIFFHENTSKNLAFLTPKILSINEIDGLCAIEMEFINAESYSTFLTKQKKGSIDTFISNVFDYIKVNIKNSKPISYEVHSELILQKTKELENYFLKSTYYGHEILPKITNYLKNNIPNTELPIGHCHGDFTLSNMLFANNSKIYLIDFLDSFIESPLIDYIKLRQDTRYYWSPFLEQPNKLRNVRLIQVLNYIDKKIEREMKMNFEYITQWEEYLTVMNFARIIPYAESMDDFDFLTNNIKKLIK